MSSNVKIAVPPKIRPHAAAEYLKRAVVDIGSNSVRLVIYEGPRRAPAPICNEKALCGLGRSMTADGSLNPGAVVDALSTLKRFRQILAEHGDPPTRTIATAAVREARDGADFMAQVKALGFEATTIEGRREAALAGLGVISYNPEAVGVIGDMGGGSLELAAVGDGALGEMTSLSLGPLRVMRRAGEDIALASQMIDHEISQLDWVKGAQAKTLYAVGGAWRAVARIHMRLRNYALPILHHYEMSDRQAIEVCDLIASQSRRSLEEIPGIPRRRLDTLPYACLALKAILRHMGAERMVVSAGGVRDGLLYEDLSDEERAQDPLTVGAAFFAQRLSPTPEVGAAAAQMTDHLFDEEGVARKRLRHAVCQLLDIGAYFHPDLRGRQVFDTALRAPFYAISHHERLMLAYALYVRHEGRRATMPDEGAVALLSFDQQQYALRLGLALRFAGAFSPKAPGPLAQCSLAARQGTVVFTAPAALEPLMQDLPRRRLEALAESFEATLRIDYVNNNLISSQ